MITDNIQILNKGLSIDTNYLQQPEGTFRYCLNGIISNNGVIENETEFIIFRLYYNGKAGRRYIRTIWIHYEKSGY